MTLAVRYNSCKDPPTPSVGVASGTPSFSWDAWLTFVSVFYFYFRPRPDVNGKWYRGVEDRRSEVASTERKSGSRSLV